MCIYIYIYVCIYMYILLLNMHTYYTKHRLQSCPLPSASDAGGGARRPSSVSARFPELIFTVPPKGSDNKKGIQLKYSDNG